MGLNSGISIYDCASLRPIKDSRIFTLNQNCRKLYSRKLYYKGKVELVTHKYAEARQCKEIGPKVGHIIKYADAGYWLLTKELELCPIYVLKPVEVRQADGSVQPDLKAQDAKLVVSESEYSHK